MAVLKFSGADLKWLALGDTCPPDPPHGFIALCLLQQGEEERGRAVSSPPHLACRKPPDRRSGRIPALPYPPLGQKTDFPFPFPSGSIGRETGNGSLS
jgi:hypothetical protein